MKHLKHVDLGAETESWVAMAEFDTDLFVIGGGSGGVRAARIAASYGARVIIAEEYRMGGTCVIRGCVPKKLLVYASHVRHEIDDAAGFGWTISSATFDWPTLIANKNKEIARLEAACTANVEKAGAHILKSRAVFEDAQTLRLTDGKRIRAKHILIATGGAPNHGKPIPGIEHVISSNEAFHLPELPKRIVIHGGGYIALEFACIFAGFGADVTVIYRGDNILRGFDEDVRTHVRSEMEKDGITVLTGCTVESVERHGEEFTSHLSNGSSIASDKVMFATGRHPNVANLGLEKAGVAINPKNGGALPSPRFHAPRCRISMPLATSRVASTSRRSRSARDMPSPIRSSVTGRRRSTMPTFRPRCSLSRR